MRCARGRARSKLRTYTEVLPQLAGTDASYSLDQLYDGVAFLGFEYRKVVETEKRDRPRPRGQVWGG